MNALAKITIAAAAISALCLVPACSSDPNPVDYLNVKGTKANVQINFNVAATRAVGSDEENKISTVNLYVFDQNDMLEKTYTNLSVSSSKVNIETTPGKKTIYAVSARQIASPEEKTSSLTDFEATIFDSSLANLKGSDGFVMIGKQENVIVEKSVSQVTSPNKIDMTMTRALAKVQVCFPSSELKEDCNALGIDELSAPYFKVMQSCMKMRIVYNNLDVVDMESASHTNGTYDVYENTADTDENWSKAPVSTTSTGGYQYMSENIVTNPTVGNTTFVSLRVKAKPTNYTRYTPNASLSTYKNPNLIPTTFYSIAFVDEATGYVDYTYNTDSGAIIYFETKEMAQSYLDAANAGTVKVKLVSELEPTPSGAPAMKKATRAASGSLKLMTFDEGKVYYRINIEDTKGEETKAMVKRNTFYTLNVKSIKKLGAPSESYLIPTEPGTSLDFSPASSGWLDTSFKVDDWNVDSSDVNL